MYNNNEAHVNSKGNLVERKIFDVDFVCSCRKRCTRLVPLEERKRLFSQYWNMGTFAGRCVLLLNCISERDGCRTYSIFEKPVCKFGLLKTLQISEGRIVVALKKKEGNTYADSRGQFSGGRNAFPAAKREDIRAHIMSFPKYFSHYTRNQTNSKYLNANLNLAKMYKLYTIKFQNPVSKSVYKRVFYEDFNLRFKKPKKDTCKKCDTYAAKIKSADPTERQMLEEWHNTHLEEAEKLQELMKKDLERSKYDPDLETLTYDMQKTLSIPRLPTNTVYYLRQFNSYNLGIHVGSTDKGIFNVWLENEASKGTQEVGSCLKKVIDILRVKNLILWSDSCGGQNRSIRLVLMMIFVLNYHRTLHTISLRYLETGHTFLPNDSDFGDFECSLKQHERVYTDVQYMKIMEDSRIENKFEVNRMSSHEFFSIKEMERSITNRKVDVDKKKINWLQTHEVLLNKDEPHIIKMKRKMNDEFQSVNIAKIGTETDFGNVNLGRLWPNGRALSKEKVQDLKSMLGLIPEEYRYFYSFLENIETHEFEEDVDGFPEELDFELED